MAVASSRNSINLDTRIFNDWKVGGFVLHSIIDTVEITASDHFQILHHPVREWWEVDLSLYYGTEESVNRIHSLFYNQEGTCSRHIGPASVCQYCKTAWLPGTLQCPNCAGWIEYQPASIEYEGKEGWITRLETAMPMADMITLEVNLQLAKDGVQRTGLRSYSLFLDDKPGTWLCGFCGMYNSGYTSKCPGCGGNRMPIKRLHSLERICVYCGQATYGVGYACRACNQRLMQNFRKDHATPW